MVKKNAIALTVVAVATLLISIVGASFAYFSAVGTKTATTTITGATPNIGAVGTATSQPSYTMNLTADQMSITNKGKSYHITSTGISETAAPVTIATMSIAGGANNLKYTCTGDVTITIPADSTIKSVLSTGSLFVKLAKGTNASQITTLTTDAIDVGSFASTGSKKVDIAYNLVSGTTTTSSTSITADVYFANTTSDQQALANKSIKLTIAVNTTSCSVSTAA